MATLIGVDVGTSGTRALAVTAGSGVVSPALAAESRLAEIRQRAGEFVDAVATAKRH